MENLLFQMENFATTAEIIVQEVKALTAAVPSSQRQATIDTSSSDKQVTQRPLTFAQFEAQKECNKEQAFQG